MMMVVRFARISTNSQQQQQQQESEGGSKGSRVKRQ